MKPIKFLLSLAAAIGCFLPSIGFGAVDMFLKIDGVKGDSVDSSHPEEIEISSFSWGLSQSGAFANAGSGGSGKVNVQDFHFYKSIDSTTPSLFIAALSGKIFPKMTFTIRRPSNSDSPGTDFFIVVLSNVRITGMNQNGAEVDANGSLLDTIALSFTKIEWTYIPTSNTGAAGVPVKGTWDLKTNKGI